MAPTRLPNHYGARATRWLNATQRRLVLLASTLAVFCQCKPADEAEYPYGVSPPTSTIIASGPLPVQPKPEAGISGQAGENSDKSPENRPEVAPIAVSPVAPDTLSATLKDPVPERESAAIESAPTAVPATANHLAGRRLRSEWGGHTTVWELRSNGFFDFRHTSPDGTTVQRMGTYQVQNGQLVTQFRELETTVGENQEHAGTRSRMASDTAACLFGSDGRIKIGKHWFVAE